MTNQGRWWVVALMLGVGCSDVNDESRDTSTRELKQSDAIRALAKKHAVSERQIILLSESKTKYPQLTQSLTAYKYCVNTCESLRFALLDEAAREVAEAGLEEAEVKFVKTNGLKLAPSLRARFDKYPDDALLVEVSLRADAEPIRYARWDELSEINAQDLTDERKSALERQRSQTEERSALLRPLVSELTNVTLSSVLVKVTRAQAFEVARLDFVLVLQLIEQNAVISVPLLANEATSTGVYAFRNRYQTFGNGIGVLIAEATLPFGPNFPQGDLGTFTNESTLNAAPGTHGGDVFYVLSSRHPTNSGTAPQARFGWLPGDRMIEHSDNFRRIEELLAQPTRTYQVYNGSFGFTRSVADAESVLGGFTSRVDAIAWNTGFTFVYSNGNLSAPGVGRTDITFSPANAFNTVAVGGSEEASAQGNKTDPNDDRVWTGGSSLNPPSKHGDRRKPEVVAPANVFTASSVSTGTSFSAPIVTGLTGLLMEKLPIARGRPDIVRALLAATATPIAGAGGGFGQLNGAQLATSMPNGAIRGAFITRTLACSDLNAPLRAVQVTAPSTSPLRVALAWLSPGGSSAPDNEPFSDLDLVIVDTATNMNAASSTTLDGTLEFVSFAPIAGHTYDLMVHKRRCGQSVLPVSVAWFSGGASIPAVPTTLGSAAP